MINDLIMMGGYGFYVWASFIITFIVCGIFYYKTRWKKIFSPDDVFVYALTSVLPRVYAAKGIEWRKTNDLCISSFRQTKEKILENKAILAKEDGSLPPQAFEGKIEILEVSYVKDGIDVRVTVDREGILISNTPFLKY